MMLELKNLKLHFGGIKAVDNCTFDVKKNTITALIGPNGAGKSTLFNLVSGINHAQSGTIHFEGKDITNQPPHKISQAGISRVFQHSRLFDNLTVFENLYLALEQEDTQFWKNLAGMVTVSKQKTKKIQESLTFVGLKESAQKQARDFSFGQKRLIELARALLKPHRLMILDEPVGGVNPALRDRIADILKKLKKQGETILLIEHDMHFTLNIADHVIVMDEGKVIAQGNPKEIKKNPKVLEAYLGE